MKFSKLKKHLLIGILLCYIISTTKPLNPIHHHILIIHQMNAKMILNSYMI